MKFPDGFFWGAATSSHQIEGGTHNNWSVWEQSANRLAYLKEREHDPKHFISGHATKHTELFHKDFSLAKSLGHNATRLSLEWARIEPEKGQYNQKEIDHYKRILEYIRSLDIEPFLTLWHWTHPVWFDRQKGFENPDSSKLFADFAHRVGREFQDLIRFWIPLNEPIVNTFFSYVVGLFPPQQMSYFKARKVKRHLIQAHKESYKALKSVDSDSCVGISKNNIYFEGRSWNPLKKLANKKWNFSFLDAVQDDLDFVGLNYYFRIPLNRHFFHRKEWTFSDIGWPLYPEGIYHVLRDLVRYQKPIFITEHGLSDQQDVQRAQYIFETLCWVHKAISEGIDVRGYLHWSLIDNFEWILGYKPRFGLVEVDYKTQERKPRLSAKLFQKICQTNRLENRYSNYLQNIDKSLTVDSRWTSQKNDT
jgi:beta-glucosidase